ncbi:hypothetical protein SDC9_195340 [bioreactor metagenome]|uniref:Uncharacterized protein n=1 Tax=bioreactor metagenome TaxID=1076179 RepID=A0A645IA09_9ZZZZ
MVKQHHDSFDSHSERVPGIFVGINVHIFQNRGIHHSTTHDFQPAGSFGDSVVGFRIESPIHIHFRTRFGEREIRRSHPDFRFPEKFGGEELDRLLQICKTDIFIDVESLDLVENTV